MTIMKLYIVHSTVVLFALMGIRSQIQAQGQSQAQYWYMDPNQVVYQQIYEDAASGDLHIQQPSPRQIISEQQQLQQMYTELFQQPPNRPQGTAPTPLDACSTASLPQSSTAFTSFSLPSNRNQFFFSMNHDHLASMQEIKKILTQQPSAMDAICTARALRDRTNRHAWVRGVVGAAMSRPDMSSLAHPPLAEMIPSLMINNPTIQKARRSTPDTCTLVDGSVGKVNGVENRLWYWREDLLINSHHWFWHLSNPFSHARLEVPVNPRPDRRGELFYYFHRGILARYHAERLSNGLAPVVPLFLNKNTILKEQYYAFLTDANSARNWTDRAANTPLEDLVSNRDFISHPANISISERLENLRRIEESIRNRALIDKTGRPIPLDSFSGIDLLAEVIEASIYSINPDYYSEFGIHNDGHFLIGLVADPDDTLQIPPSVMADGATAMRDPLFYTYHTPIDALFEAHKRTLQPYQPSGGEWPLHWPQTEITSVQVVQDSTNSRPNELSTYWNYRQVNLVRGLDFNRSDSNGSVFACVQHLDHKPFEYQISVDWKSDTNRRGGGGGGGGYGGGFGGGGSGFGFGSFGAGGSQQKATVRIFLAPRFDAIGLRYSMQDQHRYFFPLDDFQVDLKEGPNFITRKSTDSALTIPWPQNFEELERDSAQRLTPYCGCGWPQHLLIPKGTKQGQIFDLFVMVTNGNEDIVTRSSSFQRPAPTRQGCRPAFVYCGIAGQSYPDARPMNYPFDRLPYSVRNMRSNYQSFPSYSMSSSNNVGQRMVQSLDEYTFGISNMATAEVLIRHTDNSAQQNQFPSPTTGNPFQFRPTTPGYGQYGAGGGGGSGGPINFGNFGSGFTSKPQGFGFGGGGYGR